MAKSVLVGMRNVVYAIMEPDGTYGPVKKLIHAIDAVVTPSSTSSSLYADNGAVENYNSRGETTIALTLKDVEPATRAELLGRQIDGNGVVLSNNEENAPYIAIGFEGTKANGHRRLKWFLKAKVGDSPENFHTEEGGNVTFQTPTINITAVDRESDGLKEATADTDDTNVKQATIDTWFDEPYKPVAVLKPLQNIAVTSIAGTASGDTRITANPAIPSGFSAYYQTGPSVTLPLLDDVISGAPWAVFTNGDDYAATVGDDFAVIYCDASGKCKYAGKTTATVAP